MECRVSRARRLLKRDRASQTGPRLTGFRASPAVLLRREFHVSLTALPRAVARVCRAVGLLVVSRGSRMALRLTAFPGFRMGRRLTVFRGFRTGLPRAASRAYPTAPPPTAPPKPVQATPSRLNPVVAGVS